MSLENIKKMFIEDVMIPGAKIDSEQSYKKFNSNLKDMKNISEKYLIKKIEQVYQEVNYYENLLSEINPNKINTNLLLNQN